MLKAASCPASMPRGSAPIILEDLTSKSSSIGFQPLLSMPRGSAPIIPRGSAFRICLWQIHGSRRLARARVSGVIFWNRTAALPPNSRPEAYRDILPDKWTKECGWVKTPKGPHQRCEMPLIGAADASLRGLRSPEGDEQKAFWSSLVENDVCRW